jgi:hypothetical protein
MRRVVVRCVVAWPLAIAACGTASSGTSGSSSADGGDGASTIAGDAAAGTDAPAEADAGGLVVIPLTACNPSVYAADMTIGGSQDFHLYLDTGSTTLAVAGLGCATCSAAGVETLYQPGTTAVDQKVAASAMYGAIDPSGWSGEIYEDWVGVSAAPELARVKLAEITQQAQFLVGTCGPTGTPEGVIGFAGSTIETTGTNGFFDQVVAGGKVADVFATRLCQTGGMLWLGGYDPAFTTAPPVYTPMAMAGFYTVDLASIAVAGTTVAIPTGAYTGTILDTGSSGSSVSPAAFSALNAAIAGSPAFSTIFGASASSFLSGNSCMSLTQTKAELDAALPPLTLTFGSSPGVSAQASATESYLLTHGGGEWCPAITSRAPDAAFAGIAAILGAPMLVSNVVIFDRANQRVGFAPHAPCP